MSRRRKVTVSRDAHAFTARDLHSTYRLADIAPSPDGSKVAFTKQAWDERSNKTTINIWTISSDGTGIAPLTTGVGHSNTSPSWSPDGGHLAFVSERDNQKQVFCISTRGGKPHRLTNFPVRVDTLRWSPKGNKIAFSAAVYPDVGSLEETAERDKQRAKEPKHMKFDRLFIRHWDRWNDGKRNHIFVLSVKKSKTNPKWIAIGPPKDLMKGFDGDCPVPPFGGREDYDLSPDGRELAFTSQTGQDEAWSTNLDVYIVPIDGGRPKCITEENRAADSQPVYSPDGKKIAYLAMSRPGFESDRRRIKVYDRETREICTLTEDWDRSPESLAWSPDSKYLLATAQDFGRTKVFRVSATDGSKMELVGEHCNANVAVSKGDLVYYTQDSLKSGAEIWRAALDGSGQRKLTKLNESRLSHVKMVEPEEFWFVGAEGQQVQAWLLKPFGFTPGEKYPVAFVIHGGPQGATEDTFHYRWNLQAFAGAGYGVIAVNFHGSTGFGQDFTDSISGDWGGKPFQDLMMGLDYALVNYPWLDANRMAALGASFGGWMVNWINGHTDRFKCLVNHDGGFDEFVSYFTTDELWFPEWDFKGTPWENPGLYDKFSNSRYVANWKTPTLVIHGARDYRLIDGEGIATFTALQRRGIPSRLLYLPNENHWVLNPKTSILWHETVLSWLDEWLGNVGEGD